MQTEMSVYKATFRKSLFLEEKPQREKTASATDKRFKMKSIKCYGLLY